MDDLQTSKIPRQIEQKCCCAEVLRLVEYDGNDDSDDDNSKIAFMASNMAANG